MFSRIDLPLYRSPLLALTLAAGWLSLAAGLAVTALQTSAWLALCLIPIALMGADSVGRLALLTGYRSVTRLRVDRGQLRLERADGARFAVVAHPDTRLYGRLALLKLTSPGAMLQEYTVCLVDLPLIRNTDPQAFRRLRVWLRFSDEGLPAPPHTSV